LREDSGSAEIAGLVEVVPPGVDHENRKTAARFSTVVGAVGAIDYLSHVRAGFRAV